MRQVCLPVDAKETKSFSMFQYMYKWYNSYCPTFANARQKVLKVTQVSRNLFFYVHIGCFYLQMTTNNRVSNV